MAKQKSKSSDFLEIVMLSGFFSALFLACWGGWLQFSKGSKIEERNRLATDLEQMSKKLQEPASKELWINNERRKTAAVEASLYQDLTDVLGSMGPNAPKKDKTNNLGRGRKSDVPGMKKEEMKVTFLEGTPLRQYVAMLGKFKTQKPNVTVTRLRMNRKKAKEVTDSWSVELDLLSYTKESTE